ncbi:putative glutaredoxin, Thioredoxin-like superfamily [Helianthus anomalus]
MGCAPSKQPVCRRCNARCSPVRRSYSFQSDRSPPREEGSKHRVEPRASTTLGYLLFNTPIESDREREEPLRRNVSEKNRKGFGTGVVEEKTWVKVIDEKIAKIVPKTPIGTPRGEPETINAWELMEGLDDASPFCPPSTKDHIRCLSFNTGPYPVPLEQTTLPSQEKDMKVTMNSCVPDSNSNDTDVASDDIDPTTIDVKPLIDEKPQSDEKKVTVTSRVKEKLVLYYTSLRGVRKTYEDSCHVRIILKNAGVRVDERDVSMHSGFKEELKELLGDRYGIGGLPKVFVGRKYIGGADEIRRFQDEFQLDKVLEGCEMQVDRGGGNSTGGCEACGDIRFLPCETCSGSCKIYYEVDCDESEDEEEESDYGFQRCPECNENGLIRCPMCCD